MTDFNFFLESSTRSIVGSIDAIHLIEQKDRVEHAVAKKDPPMVLDTSKAFLESILKTILSDRVEAPNLEQDFGPLYRNVKDVLSLNRDEAADKNLKNIGSAIVHNVGELRNAFGAASHGDDGYYANPIEMPEAEFVARLIDSLSGFLYKKHKDQADPSSAVRIFYEDYSEFNDFYDNQNEGYSIQMGEAPDGNKRVIEISASRLLFIADASGFAYREALLQFKSIEKEEDEETYLRDEKSVLSEVATETVEQETVNEVEVVSDDFGFLEILNVMVNSAGSVEEIALDECARFVQNYAKNDAGLDWQNREPMIAKFRTLIRRRLSGVIKDSKLLEGVIEKLINTAMRLYPSR